MNKAFTLIELLVVVLIIGILAAVALPQYQKAVKRARMTQAQVLVRSIADSEVRYCLANGSYTKKLSDLDVEIPADFSLDSEEITATGKGYTFSIWLPADKSYAVAQGYYGGIGILQYVTHCGFAALECRTLESDSLGQAICLGMGGKYSANYEGELAYRL